MTTRLQSEEETITRVVIRMNATITGLVLGILSGAGLFLATLWLTVKGGPDPGRHLGLLSQYLPGYSVSFAGSVIGFAYAFVIGFMTGAILGAVHNKLAR